MRWTHVRSLTMYKVLGLEVPTCATDSAPGLVVQLQRPQ